MTNTDNPTATYRGYRRQVLYCLYRLFDDSLSSGSTLHPEGKEDLAIWSPEGSLLEVVQVKDYTNDLSASDFKPAFFERIRNYCTPDSKVKVTIAHFGALGSELLAALDNNKVTPQRTVRTLKTKLTEKGFTQQDIENILAHIGTEKVDELRLQDFVFDKLKSTVTSASPQHAFENLMWWLMNASEHQLKINRCDAIEKINKIGKFLTRRLEHEKEWNTSIVPILMERSHCTEQQNREFYKGGRVRPVHIANNLDVRRNVLLRDINEQFLQNNVVIIRAASGQGKTTLAYRYIADYSPSNFRFEVLRPTDIQHARHMAQAICGHSEAIDVPTLLYIDVRPGDKAWVDFVREVSFLPKLKILITIREEDWFKSQVRVDDFIFSEVILNFDKETGKQIFLALSNKGETNKYLNFSDAWAQLGERKTLFEFVYLLTQEEQLARKIKDQITALQEEVRIGKLHPSELKLLKLVAVASAYEARIHLKSLVNSCQLLEPQATIKRFCDEFLLRASDDGHFVEGFHAIRSEIMCSELIDEAFDPWVMFASEVIELLDENDLELFLLCSFSRRQESSKEIVSALSSFSPKSWIGMRGVSTALLWLGLDEYVDTNLSVIKDAHTLVGSGWWMMLDWDIAQVTKEKGFGIFPGMRDTAPKFELAAEASEKLINLQTVKENVFLYFMEWIRRRINISFQPKSSIDFIAMAEVVFWVGHMNISLGNNWDFEKLLDEALSILTIDTFGTFAIAVRKLSSSVYTDWYQKREEEIHNKLQRETNIVSLVKEDECLVGHYLIELDKKASSIKKMTQNDDDHIVNAIAVERAELLSQCVPGYQTYGVTGYGHLFSLFNIPLDSSSKRMPVENIMLPYLPHFNALARGVAELRLRPESWHDFFAKNKIMRAKAQDNLVQLIKAIRIKDIKKEKLFQDFDKWNENKSSTTDEVLLPLIAVDEWGFISEGKSESGSTDFSDRFAALGQLKPFLKAVTRYRHSIGNFMRQSQEAVVLLLGLREAENEQQRSTCISVAKEHGIQENSIDLSVTNAFDALKFLEKLHRHEQELGIHASQHIPTSSYREEELTDLSKAVYHWCKFVSPEEFPTEKESSNKKSFAKRLTGDLRECLIPTKNRIRESLKLLKKEGIRTNFLSEDVRWEQERVLWVSFDVDEAIDLLRAIDIIWKVLIDSLKSDHNKKIRQAVMGYYWQRIILVPLVAGKSIEQSAFVNMQITTAHLSLDEPSEQLWRFIPESVPDEIWDELSLSVWDKPERWYVFQRFFEAYNHLYQHIEHLADVIRIKNLNTNSTGEEIARKYLDKIRKKVEPHLQEAFDSWVAIVDEVNEIFKSETDILSEQWPNIFELPDTLSQLKESIVPPTDEIDGTYILAGDQLTLWRDQLKEGLPTLGVARYLWITDLFKQSETQKMELVS